MSEKERERKGKRQSVSEFMESMARVCVCAARNDSTEGGHEAVNPVSPKL